MSLRVNHASSFWANVIFWKYTAPTGLEYDTAFLSLEMTGRTGASAGHGAKRLTKPRVLRGTTMDSDKKIVTAEEFRLVDEKGKSRAVITMRGGGEPVLGFFGKDGRRRAIFGMRDDGTPAIGLYDKKGKERIKLVMDSDGSPAIRLSDEKGGNRVEVEVNSNGEPSITLLDGDGKKLAAIVVQKGQTASLSFYGKNGEIKARIE